MSFILAPTAGGVMMDKLPSNAEILHQKSMLDLAKESLTTGKFIELYDSFAGSPDSLYYKTDHHWTTLGAYYGYVEIMKSFGLASEIIPAELFEKQIASDSFYGTLWSAGGMKWVAPDSVEFWYFGNEDDFDEIFNLIQKEWDEKANKFGEDIDMPFSVRCFAKPDKTEIMLNFKIFSF